MRGKEMSNFIEFFRMVLSYLMVFAVIAAVSGIGGFIGVKVWKPKTKENEYVDMGYSDEEELATNDLEMHFIEIPKFEKKNPGANTKLEQWLWLLAGREEKLEMARKKNKEIDKAIDIINQMSMDEKEWNLYISRQRAIWDYNTGMRTAREKGLEEGIKEGREEGIKEGIKEGAKQERLEIAKNMLEEKVDIQIIAKVTGLTKEEIDKLIKKT